MANRQTDKRQVKHILGVSEVNISLVNIYDVNNILSFYRHLRVSTNLRRFANQEDLSPNAERQQPDWGGDLKPTLSYPSSDALMSDYDLERDRSYPDALGEPGYENVQPGYIVQGYPEGVVMRKKRSDRPYYPYQPQYHDAEGYPGRDSIRLPDENVLGGNPPVRTMATGLTPPGVLVSGTAQDLYAKVVKPSERNENLIPSQPREVDAGRPSFERGPEGSISLNASFALHPNGRRIDDRWRPTVAVTDGPMQQRDLQPSRDHNYNLIKPSSTDGPSRSNSQPRSYRPGERHIDGTPMFGDPSKDPSRQPMTSPSSRPTHLPLPSSRRGQYIDELAATKTPHTQQDLMQAKALSQQRHTQPSYSQYPEIDTARQVGSGFDHCIKCSSFAREWNDISQSCKLLQCWALKS